MRPVLLPLQFDEEADVAAMWQEVWEESTASAGAGLRLHMGEVVEVRYRQAGMSWCRGASGDMPVYGMVACVNRTLDVPR
jgi:hypothetical protein